MEKTPKRAGRDPELRHILINDHPFMDESNRSGHSAANLNENYMY